MIATLVIGWCVLALAVAFACSRMAASIKRTRTGPPEPVVELPSARTPDGELLGGH